MTSKSRSSTRGDARRDAARRDSARPPERPGSASRWLLPVAGLVIAGVAVLAIVLGQGGSSAVASPGPSAIATESPVVTGPPVITGASLPTFSQTVGDAAKGLAAPVVQGHNEQGDAVAITPSGKPILVLFAAHWCPHCQRELPLIQQWVEGGGLPADVELITVSTSIDPTRPNYPPEAWFKQIGWSAPVIVDPTNSVAQAYGLSGYPYFVLLDGAGNVVARASGEIAVTDLAALLAAVPRS